MSFLWGSIMLQLIMDLPSNLQPVYPLWSTIVPKKIYSVTSEADSELV